MKLVGRGGIGDVGAVRYLYARSQDLVYVPTPLRLTSRRDPKILATCSVLNAGDRG